MNCPNCSFAGFDIKDKTIKSLLRANLKFMITSPYNFCVNKHCDIVYYSKDNFYNTEDLIVKTTIKNESLDTPTCYCFKVTKGDLLNDIKRDDFHSKINFIKKNMLELGCSCISLNPEGRCCLKNNKEFIANHKSS